MSVPHCAVFYEKFPWRSAVADILDFTWQVRNFGRLTRVHSGVPMPRRLCEGWPSGVLATQFVNGLCFFFGKPPTPPPPPLRAQFPAFRASIAALVTPARTPSPLTPFANAVAGDFSHHMEEVRAEFA